MSLFLNYILITTSRRVFCHAANHVKKKKSVETPSTKNAQGSLPKKGAGMSHLLCVGQFIQVNGLPYAAPFALGLIHMGSWGGS